MYLKHTDAHSAGQAGPGRHIKTYAAKKPAGLQISEAGPAQFWRPPLAESRLGFIGGWPRGEVVSLLKV